MPACARQPRPGQKNPRQKAPGKLPAVRDDFKVRYTGKSDCFLIIISQEGLASLITPATESFKATTGAANGNQPGGKKIKYMYINV
jgi:hypothetical protein